MGTVSFFRLLLDVNARTARRRIAALRQQSWLMVSVIGLFIFGYWVSGYFLFSLGFKHLASFPGLGVMLVDRMLYLFFAFLFMMLVFSNMIIGYSSLFKSQETAWMLTLPVRQTDVFRWKLAETTVLASWAFLFLSAPLMLAYGVARHVSVSFYLKVFVLFLPFTMIPAALGSLVILLVTRYLHRRLFKWTLFGIGATAIIVVIFCLRPMQVADLQGAQMIAAMNQLLRNSSITVQPLLPSSWVAASMIAWGENWTSRGLFYFAVLLSNALMATLLCVTASSRLFYEGWSRNHSQGNLRLGVPLLDRNLTLPRTGLLDSLVGALPGIDSSTRALIIKDVRTFWRDTSQWSQFVIFFGLLGLYVLNLRNVTYDWSNEYWAAFVSFLNLGASSMTLATLTTRFVFPQFSLEGKRLWIVGMVPYGLKRVLLEKFWLSSIGAMSITVTLTLTSSAMLKVPAWLTLLFSATVVLMSFALCSIAVGIGALFPNFGSGSTANRRDDNPAKIVSGFGGTLCFVLSLMYIVLVIGAEALPMYTQFADGAATEARPWAMVGAWLFVSIISLIATVVPMTLALKHVDKLEM
jgi:ABC-2 type transport system permease protein